MGLRKGKLLDAIQSAKLAENEIWIVLRVDEDVRSGGENTDAVHGAQARVFDAVAQKCEDYLFVEIRYSNSFNPIHKEFQDTKKNVVKWDPKRLRIKPSPSVENRMKFIKVNANAFAGEPSLHQELMKYAEKKQKTISKMIVMGFKDSCCVAQTIGGGWGKHTPNNMPEYAGALQSGYEVYTCEALMNHETARLSVSDWFNLDNELLHFYEEL